MAGLSDQVFRNICRGFGAALAAWVVFLKVHPGSGAIRVERLVVAQDGDQRAVS